MATDSVIDLTPSLTSALQINNESKAKNQSYVPLSRIVILTTDQTHKHHK